MNPRSAFRRTLIGALLSAGGNLATGKGVACSNDGVNIQQSTLRNSDTCRNPRTDVDCFRAGFYVYPYLLETQARHLGMDPYQFSRNWMRCIRRYGFDLFYIAVGLDHEWWMELAEELDFQIIMQIDAAYLGNHSIEEVRSLSNVAIEYIARYINHPRVAAFSVKEEPMPNKCVRSTFITTYLE